MSEANLITVNTENQQDAVVMHFTGRVDTISSKDFEQLLNDEIAKSPNYLIIDFSGIDYISSAGLRVLLVVAKKLPQNKFCIYGMRPTIRQVFDISGFAKILRIFSTLEEALSSK